MPISVICPGCLSALDVPEAYAGKRGRCKKCGGVLEIPEIDAVVAALAEMAETKAAADSPFDEADERPLPPAPPGRPRPKEYRVVTMKDKWFSGKFDPEKLETAMNDYARKGYVLKTIATASVPGLGGMRDEIIIVFER